MDTQLEQFLNLVWTNREPILSDRKTGKIYDLYSGQFRSREDFGFEMHGQWVQTADPLMSGRVQSFVESLISIGDEWVVPVRDLNWSQLRELVITEKDADMIESAGVMFYQWNRPGRDASATGRVYLNVRSEFADLVMKHVINSMVRDPMRFSGVQAAKIWGPAVPDRRDTIVIYMTGDNDGVLDNLAAYQKTNPKHFGSATPAVVRPIVLAPNGDPLSGVGIATEPPEVENKKISFGKSRTNVIYDVLSSVCTPIGVDLRGNEAALKKAEFFTAVEVAFRKARITSPTG